MTSAETSEVLIVGTGFSGIGIAIKLKEAGINSFTLLERAGEMGGTWRDNTYPGCGCDVKSHLYSLSFEPNPDWSEAWSSWSEIGEYIRRIAHKHGLYEHTRFHTTMTEAAFDERAGVWRVTTDTGETFTAKVLVAAVGGLSNPAYPNINGLEDFQGAAFHSARWDHDYELEGKNVAVIGTGASAIQFVPAIADKVRNLKLFQRTPPWVIPKPNRRYFLFEKWLFRYLPGWRRLYRAMIYWINELLLGAFINPNSSLRGWGTKLALRHLEDQVPDEALREKLTPDYAIGCKRVLLSSNYYPALTKPNVEVVTDPIDRIASAGLVTDDGESHDVDAIIFGTGFQIEEYVGQMNIRGLGGKDLQSFWRDNGFPHYLGTTVSGFPNLFVLAGPNTGIGHTSLLYMVEAQINYVMQCIAAIRDKHLHYIDVKPEVQAAFDAELQEKSKGTVWTSGCNSWYLSKSGKNFTIWPDNTYRFKERTSTLSLADYRVVESVEDAEIVPEASAATQAFG